MSKPSNKKNPPAKVVTREEFKAIAQGMMAGEAKPESLLARAARERREARGKKPAVMPRTKLKRTPVRVVPETPLLLDPKKLKPHALLGRTGMLSDLIQREDAKGNKDGSKREARKARAEELREELAGIRESMAAEGIKDVLKVCQGSKGQWLILDGRHRTELAIELGLATVPCKEYPAEQAREIIMASAVRRHISKGAKAYQAVCFYPEVATDAKSREKAGKPSAFSAEGLAKKVGVSERLITDAIWLYNTFNDREDAREHYEASIYAGVALAKVKSGVGGYIQTGKLAEDDGEDETDPTLTPEERKSADVMNAYLTRVLGLETSWKQWEKLTPQARKSAAKVTVKKIMAAPADVIEALREALTTEA